MNKYYSKYLIEAIQLHNREGWNFDDLKDHGYIYSESVVRKIRSAFNRFVKIGATAADVEAWVNGDYLHNEKALEYYFRFCGCNRQVSSVELANELNIYDIDQLRCVLRGMSIKHPDLCYYTDTHDLDSLTIRK